MSSLTPRERFDRSIKALFDEVLVLGSMVEQAVLESIDVLARRDLDAAHALYRRDELINQKRYQIEKDVLTLIATQQPMARDLRILSAVLEIITELERMGDYGKGIAKITILMGDEPVDIPIADLRRMAEQGLDMLHRALGAFIDRDDQTARSIPKEDDQIDALYNHIYREAIAQIVKEPAANVDQGNYIIWAAHNLERMADRVTNICERIVFVVTGEMREMDVTDDELYPRAA
ncbi:MAG: phosphate signaling complex protein PhoU [Chloroflexi bacterium]|jgi:phosphate transport system protein|nr:phosphate signaling complex protein PhoU [Chloroflexota bacterium]